jgi:hypothetical protein
VKSQQSCRVIPKFWVKWYSFIDAPSTTTCTYDSTEINKFKFSEEAFVEIITPAKYCHPYFDFDHIESKE